MYLMVVISISFHIHFFSCGITNGTIMCSPFFLIGSIGMFHGSIDPGISPEAEPKGPAVQAVGCFQVFSCLAMWNKW